MPPSPAYPCSNLHTICKQANSHTVHMYVETPNTHKSRWGSRPRQRHRPPPRRPKGQRPLYTLSSRPCGCARAVPARQACGSITDPRPTPTPANPPRVPPPLRRLLHRLRGRPPGCDLISLIYRSGSRQPHSSFPTCSRAPAPSFCFPAVSPTPGGGGEGGSVKTEARSLGPGVTVASRPPVPNEVWVGDKEAGGGRGPRVQLG